MTSNNHPITPTSELVHQWHREACRDPYNGGAFFRSKTLEHIATQAANWGWQQRDASVADELQKARDEELDACCEFLEARHASFVSRDLHAARRPQPPSLAEEALDAIDEERADVAISSYKVIRRALERLQELEDNQ